MTSSVTEESIGNTLTLLNSDTERTMASSATSLEETLFDSFGFSEFRPGQKEVVEAILSGRDALVLWATGQGKSLCYQLPTIHSQRTAVIVSPLISLMHDQVVKLNATVGEGRRVLAVLLGSAQVDPSVEQRALQGEFRFIFLSPEKLLQTGFLEKLQALHYSKGLSLVAVDEAHCMSEWGHQFRREYQQLGAIRSTLGLSVPIVALTATAVDAVRKDIVKTLQLEEPFTSISSVDRANLSLKVTLLPSGGASQIHTNLQPTVDAIRSTGGSTIVYAPTREKVKTLAAVLDSKLSQDGIQVLAYTGEMTPADRADVHQRFLDNRCLCVVATIAFGMGIDKPDIRRIVHYGACKTFEEYYQQVGRAGRDGMPAECNMICTDHDFINFRSDFYVGGLGANAKKAVLLSLDKLHQYAQDCTSCRRRLVMDFFGEVPSFQRCTTCDNCLSSNKYVSDQTRDFGVEARVLLRAVKAGDGHLGKSALRKIIQGSYKPKSGHVTPQLRQAMEEIAIARKVPKLKGRTLDFYESLLAPLIHAKYVERSIRDFSAGSRKITYEAFHLTSLGNSALVDKGGAIQLPVPALVRKEEREQREKIQKQKDKLVQAGVPLESVPTAELNSGSGPAIDAHLQWIRTLESYRKRGDISKAESHEELLRRIETWRDGAARRLRMAPAAVIPPDIARRIAYSKPTQPETLRAVGLRIAESESLLEVVANWKAEFGYGVSEVEVDSSTQATEAKGDCIRFPEPCRGERWSMFVYKPKNSWEESWKRFSAGENHETIAMTPGERKSRRALAPATIVGHLMKAVECGHEVDLNRLVHECKKSTTPAPTSNLWKQMEDACAASGVDVLNEEKLAMKSIVRCMVLHDVDKDPSDKTEQEKSVEHACYAALRWYVPVIRARIRVTFEKDSNDARPLKRQKT